jgi:hypothetical protein
VDPTSTATANVDLRKKGHTDDDRKNDGGK